MRAPKGRVKEGITPRGDGNRLNCNYVIFIKVKEGITPRGDGNSNLLVGSFLHVSFVKEGITPRGDGNGSLEEVL